jgi:2-polyprenyl-3-methyl-5-hydroxy-6-metoxy-1,4-benzoquinol methylase
VTTLFEINNYRTWPEDSVFPGHGAPFFAEHLARYKHAIAFVENKTVLELASGKGYGSYLLSNYCKSIIGIDLNEESLDFASRNYINSNLKFTKQDVTKLASLDQKFDVIIAFEIIEHIQPEQTEQFLKGISNTLKENGCLLISTPNHEVPDFHINNFKAIELYGALTKFFTKTEMLGQFKTKGLIKDFIFALDCFNLRHNPLTRLLRRKPQVTKLETFIDHSKPWKIEDGWGEAGNYVFSKNCWRQAGETLAICQK